MNKTRIDQMIPSAYKALSDCGIAKNGKIVKTYRGQISTFGAAISGGSLIAAVAFFSEKGASDTERPALMKAIYSLIIGKDATQKNALFDYVVNQVKAGKESACKEDIINAALALKLAMNVYELTDK